MNVFRKCIFITLMILIILCDSDSLAEVGGIVNDQLRWELNDEGLLTIDGTGQMKDFTLNEVPWYSKRSRIKAVCLEQNVSSIGNNAFNGCYELKSVEIPNSVKSIGDYAFSGCESLMSITIPNSITNIGDGVFSGCHNLTEIILPNSVKRIGGGVFSNCDNLSAISIPSSLTSISEYMFSGCINLSSIVIPSNITRIEAYAFSTCRSLKSILISDSVTYIGKGAFQECSYLSDIIVPNGIETKEFFICYRGSLLSITLPDSISEVSADAFGGTCIGQTVFPDFIVPDQLRTIEEEAFSGIGARYIHFTSEIRAIEDLAFSGCRDLRFAFFETDDVQIAENAFFDCYDVCFIIPAEDNKKLKNYVDNHGFRYIEDESGNG